MRKPFSSVAIGLILLSTAVLPPLVFMVFNTSSMAAGVLLISGLHVFLFVVLCTTLRQTQRLGAVAILFAAVLGVVMTHGAITLLINDDFDFGRFSQSYLFLIIYLLGAFSFALMAQRVPNFQADFAVKLVFYVLLLSGFAGILKYSPFSGVEAGKPVLFLLSHRTSH
ncbi:MAG: hypothetical protein DDT21_02611 [Syntrophomonadaceae bacterium]|nr:hypothetical protein [Bacillota bacterium]